MKEDEQKSLGELQALKAFVGFIKTENEVTRNYALGENVAWNDPKLDALKLAEAALGYAQSMILVNPDLKDVCDKEIERWKNAIAPIEDNNWEALKKEIIIQSKAPRYQSPEKSLKRQALHNLANSLP